MLQSYYSCGLSRKSHFTIVSCFVFILFLATLYQLPIKNSRKSPNRKVSSRQKIYLELKLLSNQNKLRPSRLLNLHLNGKNGINTAWLSLLKSVRLSTKSLEQNFTTQLKTNTSKKTKKAMALISTQIATCNTNNPSTSSTFSANPTTPSLP